jgi:hypothetical protein
VLYGLSSAIARVCVSPDSKRVAALAHNWQIGVWDRTGRLLHVFDVPEGFTADNGALAFSPNSTHLGLCPGNARNCGTLTRATR